MVRHEEAVAERSDHPDGIALGRIAQVVRSDPFHRLAGVIRRDALDGKRDVVIARTFAFARARDRIQPDEMRAPLCIRSGWNDADRLPFQYREGRRAEIQNDMADIARCSRRRKREIAAHRRQRSVRDCIQVHVRMRGRPRRRGNAALTGTRLGGYACDFRRDGQYRADPGVLLRRQRIPGELFVERVDLALGYLPPVVDRAGGTRCDADIAPVALRGVDNVVARVMRDRVDRARLLAGVAANADLRVDQVLADEFDRNDLRAHRSPRR